MELRMRFLLNRFSLSKNVEFSQFKNILKNPYKNPKTSM